MLSAARPAGRAPGLPVSFALQGPAEVSAVKGGRQAVAQRSRSDP